jgi:hypothetical protein
MIQVHEVAKRFRRGPSNALLRATLWIDFEQPDSE